MQSSITEQEALNQLQLISRVHTHNKYSEALAGVSLAFFFGLLTAAGSYRRYLGLLAENNEIDNKKVSEEQELVITWIVITILGPLFMLWAFSQRTSFRTQELRNLVRAFADLKYAPMLAAPPQSFQFSLAYTNTEHAMRYDGIFQFLKVSAYSPLGANRIRLSDQPGSATISLRGLANLFFATNIQGFMQLVDQDIAKLQELTITLLQGRFGSNQSIIAQLPDTALSKILTYCSFTSSMAYLKAIWYEPYNKTLEKFQARTSENIRNIFAPQSKLMLWFADRSPKAGLNMDDPEAYPEQSHKLKTN